jgi:hypothetical protein
MKLARITVMVLSTVAALAVTGPAMASTPAAAAAPRPAMAPGRTPAPAARAATGAALAGDALIEGGSVQSAFSYNESGKAITVETLGTGEYDLVFAGLGGISVGNVQVSTFDAYGSCEPYDWGPTSSHTAFVALVDCFSGGSLASEEFFITVTQPRSKPGGVYDYAFMDRFTGSGRLTGGAQYNSEGKADSVKYLGTGRYQVLLGGKKTTGTTGVVKVSAFGTAESFCNPTGWKGSRSGEVVDVDCFSATGAAENELFSLAYATSTNVMGSSKLVTVNAYANSSAAVYQPGDQYNSRRGARVTVAHLGSGYYEVLLAGSPSPASNFGDFQLNVVSSRGICTLGAIAEQQSTRYATSLDVFCVTTGGTPTNLPFDVEFAVR